MINRILVIDLAYMGDIVTMNPALDVIARSYPDCKLTIATRMGSEIGVQFHPAIERIVSWDKSHRRLGLIRFTNDCRNKDGLAYQAAFAFHNSFNAAAISFLSNARVRVGYKTELRQWLLTQSYALPKNRMHLMDSRLKLLELFGLTVTPEDYQTYRMHLPHSVTATTKSRLLADLPNLPTVVLSVAASWPSKTWLPEEMNKLLHKFQPSGVNVVLIGRDHPDDHKVANSITNSKNQIKNLVGKTTLTELAGLVGSSDLVITPDNGVMHIASALDRPVVAVFAPTDPRLCGPRSEKSKVVEAEEPCTKCYLIQCPRHKECMSTVTAERVWEKVKELVPELV